LKFDILKDYESTHLDRMIRDGKSSSPDLANKVGGERARFRPENADCGGAPYISLNSRALQLEGFIRFDKKF
jgi:hypothetical protein